MKKVLIAAALLTIAGVAGAQSKSASGPIYGELGIHGTEFDLNGLPKQPNLTLGSAILGYQFHPNFSAEVFLANGISKADYGYGINANVDYGVGLMLRPSYKFTDKFEAFARLGYGHYKLTFGLPGATFSGTESSLVYGVGANYYFTDKVYGQLSYTSFYDKDGLGIRGFGASVGYKF